MQRVKTASNDSALTPQICRKQIVQIPADSRTIENAAWLRLASQCVREFPQENWELYLGPIRELKGAN